MSRLITTHRDIDQRARAGGTGGLMNNLNLDDDSALVDVFFALEIYTVKSYTVCFV